MNRFNSQNFVNAFQSIIFFKQRHDYFSDENIHMFCQYMQSMENSIDRFQAHYYIMDPVCLLI